MVDGTFKYRDEDENCDVIEEPDMMSDEDGLASTHWSGESTKWRGELERWQKFKEAQRIHNQLGRSEIELELDNTDVDLVEALSKVNDWQEFHFIQQRKVHKAERFHERSQKEIARLQNLTVPASRAESERKIPEPRGGWMLEMQRDQERLDACQEELTWVKSQWTMVLAEASRLIASAPKLQKELEDKLEKQTNAIYSHLKHLGARPSHTVHPPTKTPVFSRDLSIGSLKARSLPLNCGIGGSSWRGEDK